MPDRAVPRQTASEYVGSFRGDPCRKIWREALAGKPGEIPAGWPGGLGSLGPGSRSRKPGARSPEPGARSSKPGALLRVTPRPCGARRAAPALKMPASFICRLFFASCFSLHSFARIARMDDLTTSRQTAPACAGEFLGTSFGRNPWGQTPEGCTTACSGLGAALPGALPRALAEALAREF